ALAALRPASGPCPRAGFAAFPPSLDQIGPVTKTVRDCARLYEIIAGLDPADTTTVELPQPAQLPAPEDLKGLRIGVPKELSEAEGIESGVTEQVQKAIDVARELG